MKKLIRACLVVITVAMAASMAQGKDIQRTAAGHPVDGALKPFMGEPAIDIKQVHKGGRFPNIVVALDGTLLNVWNGVKVRRSEDAGETWGEDILIAKGFMGGGVTVNETNGDILAFVEERHPVAPWAVHRSQDNGKTWAKMEVEVKPDKNGNIPSMHMNEHGITLRRGKHAGRLIRPTRNYAGKNDRSLWPKHYTNAMYSDDGGKTWQTSDPFPAFGTGEATLAELSDGRIYYNSRRHWAPEGVNPLRRWTAWSDDGGHTWKDVAICEVLPDGGQNRSYGLMGGLVRLPVKGRDILIFSNIVSPGGRHHGAVWASFDGGKTWPIQRLVDPGSFAYSSITAGRPGTRSEGWIFLNYESGGSKVARFNLAWVLAGEETGDGKVPDWVK